MTGDRGRDNLRGREGLALPDHADLLVDVVAERERTAQRDLLGRVAADDRVLHVEVRVGDRRLHAPRERDALLREARLELRRRVEDVPDEVVRDRRVVDRPLLEREHPRRAFLDDADLDAAGQREPPALVLRDDRAVRGVAAVGEALVAEARVRLEHDPLAAAPLLEAVGPGADRVRHHPARAVGVSLDDLAGDGRRRRRREVGEELGVGKVEADADRVAVDRLKARDRLVVVELAALLRRCDEVLHADEATVEHLHRVRAHPRVHHPLPRVDVVLGRQLALLPLERRVVGEIDARLDADRPGLPAVGDLGQRDRGVRDELVRPRQVVVLVGRVEDHAVDRVAVDVARRGGVEAGLRGREHRADHLVGIRLCVRDGPDRERRGEDQEAGPVHGLRHRSFFTSASRSFGSVCGA